MPTYDYVCRECGTQSEFFQPITEAPKRKCPACGRARLQRQIGTGAAILFRGSGFYQTDYRSESYKQAAQADSAAAKGATDDAAKTKSHDAGNAKTTKVARKSAKKKSA